MAAKGITNRLYYGGKVFETKVATLIDRCRACGSDDISELFSLGDIRVARFSDDTEDAVKAPLTFFRCEKCTYLQLLHNINTDLVFYDQYGYESGINPSMVRELKSIVESSRKIVDVKKGDIWLDIASNDGELLLQVTGRGVLRVGFDPSRDVALKGSERLIKKFGAENTRTFIDYFNKKAWKLSLGNRKAKVITAIAVFYSVQEPNKFLEDVKEVLDPEGLFVVQQNYTPEMIRQLAFCNVVHEHVTYPTFTAFNTLVEKHGFEAVDVSKNEINGGSFRVYLKHKGAKVKVRGGKGRVAKFLEAEKEEGYLGSKVYKDFAMRVAKKGRQVNKYIKKEVVRRGKKVYGLAASTRGNTRLQVWGLGPELISGIAERNPRKVGKKTLGIPIVDDDEALKKADLLFVSIWFYGDSIIDPYKDFLKKGGKMLFPSSPTGEPYLVEMVKGKIVKKPLPFNV